MIKVYPESANILNVAINMGGITLLPTKCELTAELNGSWELSLTQPCLGDERWKAIVPGAIISAPSFNGMQMFRVIKTELSLGEINAVAYPVFMDAMNWIFITQLEISEMTGTEAVSKINDYISSISLTNAAFTVQSDITRKGSLNLKNVNLITAINGDDEDSQSFVNTFFGQVEYNNTQCIIHEKMGNQTPVEFRFGKNITGLTKTVSREELTTRIYPISKDGYTISGSQPWCDGVSDVENPYARSVVFENLELEGAPESGRNDALRLMGVVFFSVEGLSGNDITKEKETYEVDLALLNDSQEYQNAGYSQKVSLGDMVHILAEEYGVDYTAQITQITYDCIKDTATAITVGQPVSNYFNLNSLRTISKDIKSWTIEDVNL